MFKNALSCALEKIKSWKIIFINELKTIIFQFYFCNLSQCFYLKNKLYILFFC